jgi:hypothetical protein
MTTNRDDETRWTSRERGALGAATAAVTLALGVTLAALSGRLAPPERDAPPDEAPVAAASAERQPGSRVVLVPVERAPLPSEAAGLTEPTPEVAPHADEVDGEHERRERHERSERREHREHREHRERRHASFWSDDEEGFDG